MHKIIFLIFSSILFFSCKNNNSIIPKEKMEEVLWDVAQGGEFVNGYVYSTHPELNRAAVNNQMIEKICSINHITKKQFDNSLEYYRNHPQELKVIVDSVTSKYQRLRGDSTGAPIAAPAPEPSTPDAVRH